MGSKKRSAWAKEKAQFGAQLEQAAGELDDIFAGERHRVAADAARKEEALREKACASKNRYSSRAEAEDAIVACAQYGRSGLRCYRCEYCKGWHLTSRKQES